MKVEDLLDLIEKLDGVGIGSEIFFEVKSVDSFQDFAKLTDAYAIDVCEDGGDLVLVLH